MCWLGDVCRSLDLVSALGDSNKFKWQCWVATSVGELLAAAPTLLEPPPREQLAVIMSICLDQYAKGKLSALARLLRIDRGSLEGYLQKKRTPYFSSLLHLSHILSISPLEFLTTKAGPLPGTPSFSVDHLPAMSRSKWKRVEAVDIQFLRQALAIVLLEGGDPLPSIKRIAQRLGYSAGTLCKYCPDLYYAIVRRNKRRFTEASVHIRMRQALENALTYPEPQPLAAIARQLGCNSKTLRKRFPSLCQAIIQKYRERFKYGQIQQTLHEVLSSNGETPSLGEIASQMGCKREIIEKKFPGMCKQITARRRLERRKRHEERTSTVCIEIRKIMLVLHKQNIYPSASKVSKLLNDPHVMRIKEGLETWRAMLRELGYLTDTIDLEE